jgi:hypothetical protein
VSDLLLEPDELERLSGYSRLRPSLQLASLHRQGFYRARRGEVTGEVILTRAHVEAVESGQVKAPPDAARNAPKLRRAA